MTKPLFQLGSFQFDLPNGVPQSLERTAYYRWEEQGRLLRDPAHQFLGPGSQEITLDGNLFPGFSGRQTTMETLREAATKGEPQMLTDGLGRVYGKWAVKQIREGLDTFAPGGGARRITFSVQLVKYAEDNPGQAASPFSMNLGSSLAGNVTAAIAPYKELGSSFLATDWSQNPVFSQASTAAQGAGFNLGQLASISRSIGVLERVAPTLNAFGLSGFSTAQTGAWSQLGINAPAVLQQLAAGRGPAAMIPALEALGPASGASLLTLGGAQGSLGLAAMVRNAATILTILDVDPFVTASVRQQVQLP